MAVTNIRVGVINQCIQHFNSLPDAHTSLLSTFMFNSGFDIVSHCLFFCG